MKINWNKVLPVVSCTGVAATCGLSFWGGRKYEEKKEENGKKALLYLIPGLAAAVGSMISIAVNKKITGKEIAVLTGSCAYLVHERDKFKEVMKEKLVNEAGMNEEKAEETIQEATEEVHKRMAAEIVHNDEKFSIPYAEESGHGDTLCIDGWSGRVFKASKEWVESAIAKFKAFYEVDHSCVCLNDLYELLNILPTHMGWRWGYPADAEGTCGFGVDTLDIYVNYIEDDPTYHMPVVIIEYGYDSYPIECWYEY